MNCTCPSPRSPRLGPACLSVSAASGGTNVPGWPASSARAPTAAMELRVTARATSRRGDHGSSFPRLRTRAVSVRETPMQDSPSDRVSPSAFCRYRAISPAARTIHPHLARFHGCVKTALALGTIPNTPSARLGLLPAWVPVDVRESTTSSPQEWAPSKPDTRPAVVVPPAIFVQQGFVVIDLQMAVGSKPVAAGRITCADLSAHRIDGQARSRFPGASQDDSLPTLWLFEP